MAGWDQGGVRAGEVVETKGGRRINVSRQGGGRKVTWASIRAAAPMLSLVWPENMAHSLLSDVNLSFVTTNWSAYLVTSSTIFLLLPTIRDSVIL